MDTPNEAERDVMQVCRNGHVITGLLRAADQGMSHCDRCGAETFDRCPTCGLALAGANHVPGLVPIGQLRPPAHCAACGVPFPWTLRFAQPVAGTPLANLEALLRRLPRVVRQLRARHSDRPPFRVRDEYDLEDLLRALLAIYFDDIRPESRTPSYAASVRTDFRIQPADPEPPLVVTCKRVAAPVVLAHLTAQVHEDVAYYEKFPASGVLMVYWYDPEGLLPDPTSLEKLWSDFQGKWRVGCVIAQ